VRRAGGGRARGCACPGVGRGRRGGGQSSRWGKLQFLHWVCCCAGATGGRRRGPWAGECVRGVCWWYERALPWGSQSGGWNVPVQARAGAGGSTRRAASSHLRRVMEHGVRGPRLVQAGVHVAVRFETGSLEPNVTPSPRLTRDAVAAGAPPPRSHYLLLLLPLPPPPLPLLTTLLLASPSPSPSPSTRAPHQLLSATPSTAPGHVSPPSVISHPASSRRRLRPCTLAASLCLDKIAHLWPRETTARRHNPQPS
jgi:hypothetical protein